MLLPLLITALAADLALGTWCLLLVRRGRLREPRLSNTFRDARGRLWTVRIDTAALKRVKALCGVDLLELVGRGEADGSAPKAIARLLDDPVLLVDVLYVLCKPEADAREVSDEQFGRALAGDAISDALEASLGGLVDFFPSRSQRARLKRMLSTTLRLMGKTDAVIDRTVTPEATEAILRRALTGSGSPRSSQASPASTPAR